MTSYAVLDRDNNVVAIETDRRLAVERATKRGDCAVMAEMFESIITWTPNGGRTWPPRPPEEAKERERDAICGCCDEPIDAKSDHFAIGDTQVCEPCRASFETRTDPAVVLAWGRTSIPHCPLCALRGPQEDGDTSGVNTKRWEKALCHECRTTIDRS